MTRAAPPPILRAMTERLTSLDGSFLRVETPNAHMHVAWSATFRVPPDRPRPSLRRLRASVASRLERTPRFRRRLAWPPPGLGEPFWVDDPSFDVARHVGLLGEPDEELDDRRFAELCDGFLSTPLDRRLPLWRIELAPRLSGGRCGMVAKMHHALVDGKSAVEVATLLFDVAPDAPAQLPRDWRPAAEPSSARLALEALAGGAGEPVRAARRVARLAGSPLHGGRRVAGTLRGAALAVGGDLLRAAPPSRLNAAIGPGRTLVRHSTRIQEVLRVKRATGATLNDVCLAAVAGALRELALARGEHPRPLKTMVPVSLRGDAERAALGNRISLVFVDLPLHLSTPRARLEQVRRATAAFKASGRAEGAGLVFSALGLLPDPLRGAAARRVGRPRVYNLTVSNIPGPRFPLYMLGAELLEAHPVVPIAEGHALAIGIFTHRDHLFWGLYADPDAFPEVTDLPAALASSLVELPGLRRLRPKSPQFAGIAGGHGL
jgi:diacylglycerol O-acyltransferase / wax synthase